MGFVCCRANNVSTAKYCILCAIGTVYFSMYEICIPKHFIACATNNRIISICFVLSARRQITISAYARRIPKHGIIFSLNALILACRYIWWSLYFRRISSINNIITRTFNSSISTCHSITVACHINIWKGFYEIILTSYSSPITTHMVTTAINCMKHSLNMGIWSVGNSIERAFYVILGTICSILKSFNMSAVTIGGIPIYLIKSPFNMIAAIIIWTIQPIALALCMIVGSSLYSIAPSVCIAIWTSDTVIPSKNSISQAFRWRAISHCNIVIPTLNLGTKSFCKIMWSWSGDLPAWICFSYLSAVSKSKIEQSAIYIRTITGSYRCRCPG